MKMVLQRNAITTNSKQATAEAAGCLPSGTAGQQEQGQGQLRLHRCDINIAVKAKIPACSSCKRLKDHHGQISPHGR